MCVRGLSVVGASLVMSLTLASCMAPAPGAGAAGPGDSPPRLIAQTYDSGFPQGHDTYNGMGTGSDGKIYYVLCSEAHDVAGQMYCFDPATGKIRHLGDLTEACGEKGMKAVAQGKCHNNLVECDGKLYFATHTGFYAIIDDMEKIGPPPPGWKPYQGGHFLSYDMATGRFENLALAPGGEGILTMNMDTRRGRLYGLTWPGGHFIRYDLARRELKDLGPTSLQGENGKGANYRTLCRSFAIDPEDGSVYFSIGDGAILRYRYDRDAIETLQGENLKKDYFGLYDPTNPGHMAYNWRQVIWHPGQKAVYGVHGNSGYLFRFDPRPPRVTVLDRLTSLPSRRSGMYDQFSYGYLGFTLGPDGRTLYYLTGGPIYVDGKRVTGKESTGKGEAKGLEDLHLVTYDIPAAKYTDHGAVFYKDGQRPLYVNSIAVGRDGTVYTLARIARGGHTVTDLVAIPAPLTPSVPPCPLTVRMQNYGKYDDAAWTHLPSIGIARVFTSVPAADHVATVAGRLAEHNLQPLVLRGQTDLGRESCVEELASQLAVCERMGVRYMFLSPRHTGASRQVACERLRQAGEIARKHGVTIALETHPDLGTNADAHLATMKEINHPNVRVNFDTGNITFYNKGAEAVTELKKIIDYVATVELKDHSGRYMEWNFPVLGTGVVDFPGVLKVLKDHRFRGPITLEVEGVRGVEMTETQTKQYIADSVRYVQKLGDLP
ncbi:MAG: Inosose dehydratase [Planctomycetes bacterium ADurb.Bin126]|nr:MAG: Inosose dehydratase [Planctomycetes bacterium ADurb.Bin126]